VQEIGGDVYARVGPQNPKQDQKPAPNGATGINTEDPAGSLASQGRGKESEGVPAGSLASQGHPEHAKTGQVSKLEQDRSDRAGRAEAERRARTLVDSGSPILVNEITHILETWVGRRNTDRKRVLPPGWSSVQSDTFGVVKSHSGGLVISNISREFPYLTEALGLYAHQIAGGTNFGWTSMTVNTGFASSPHRDSGNLGPSMLQAFGNFTGGELLTWQNDDRYKPIKYNLRQKPTVENARNPIFSTDASCMEQTTSRADACQWYGSSRIIFTKHIQQLFEPVQILV